MGPSSLYGRSLCIEGRDAPGHAGSGPSGLSERSARAEPRFALGVRTNVGGGMGRFTLSLLVLGRGLIGAVHASTVHRASTAKGCFDLAGAMGSQ